MPLFDVDQAVSSDELSMEYLPTLSQVVFKGDHMYHPHLFHVNYTTYDILCTQDNINPQTNHPDIMMLVPLESAHPFLYAHILHCQMLGIFVGVLIWNEGCTRGMGAHNSWFVKLYSDDPGWMHMDLLTQPTSWGAVTFSWLLLVVESTLMVWHLCFLKCKRWSALEALLC